MRKLNLLWLRARILCIQVPLMLSKVPLLPACGAIELGLVKQASGRVYAADRVRELWAELDLSPQWLLAGAAAP